MASKITITFNSLPALDTQLFIIDDISANKNETFKTLRSGVGESTIGTSTITAAFNYANAIGLDYNNTSLYTITRSSNVVTITANNAESQFSILSNTTLGAVTTLIENDALVTPFTIISYVPSEADLTPCDKVKLTVTLSEQADAMTLPINEAVTANPHITTVDRSDNIFLQFVKGESAHFKIAKIPKLLSTYFTLDIVQSPSSTSLSVSNTLPIGHLLTLTYSLDDSIYQTSTNFPNLSAGSYNLYIKDGLGCKLTIPFSVTAFTPNLVDYTGICEISNINSIRYKEDVVWNDYVLKTPYNTLSFEEDVDLPNKSFLQLFSTRDIITTQIKTNYATVTATLIDELGTETSLLTEKKTANMNVTDVRDGVIVSVPYNSTNYIGIKYSGGKVYDPTSFAEIADYNLGENVPSWMNIDDYVNIEGTGWYKVLDVVYSTDAYVLVVNLQATDFPFIIPATKKITSVYNIVDWENHEFGINFSSLEGYYKVKVVVTDTNFSTKNYLSEWLYVKDNHDKTFLIEAYNTKNNEINFSTGFSTTLRIPYVEKLKYKTNTEQEIYVTDTNTTPLENKYRGFWDFSSRPLPTIMAEKLALVLLQDRLFIDGVSYVVEGAVEANNIGSQYQIKANLVKSDYAFNSNSGKGLGVITIEGTLLSISPGGGFLRVD